MSDATLDLVEHRLDQLIQRYQQLEKEHQILRNQEQQWLSERARLIEKHEIAKARIEAMIKQLKKLEVDAQ